MIALVLGLGLTGCPRGTRKTLVPDVPQSGAAEARTRFAEAKAKFARDGQNSEEFRAIAEDFPEIIAIFQKLGLTWEPDSHLRVKAVLLDLAETDG